MNDAAAQRYKLTLAYDGSTFHGWQKQEPPGVEPLRTVQGVVERVLIQVFRQPITLVGASRTDAGVHARGQVAHFDAATGVPVDRMAAAITSRLPDDVEAISVAPAAPDFDAIAGARLKQYRYRIHNTAHRPLGLRHQVYHCWTPLDVDAMSGAAGRLVGEHDLEGFSAAGHGRETTVRVISRCEAVRRADEFDASGSASGGRVDVVVAGSGFLYHTVRIIAGTLVEVGRGRFDADRIDRVLATADRRLAGPTLPPNGLCLEWIRYGDDG